jgi:hypothetical protein
MKKPHQVGQKLTRCAYLSKRRISVSGLRASNLFPVRLFVKEAHFRVRLGRTGNIREAGEMLPQFLLYAPHL